MARIGKNPLESGAFDVEKERQEIGFDIEKKSKRGRPRKDDLIRESGVQQGLQPDYTRATFIIKKDYYQLLKDYAYTERITLKEALEQMCEVFFDDVDTDSLLHKE